MFQCRRGCCCRCCGGCKQRRGERLGEGRGAPLGKVCSRERERAGERSSENNNLLNTYTKQNQYQNKSHTPKRQSSGSPILKEFSNFFFEIEKDVCVLLQPYFSCIMELSALILGIDFRFLFRSSCVCARACCGDRGRQRRPNFFSVFCACF